MFVDCVCSSSTLIFRHYSDLLLFRLSRCDTKSESFDFTDILVLVLLTEILLLEHVWLHASFNVPINGLATPEIKHLLKHREVDNIVIFVDQVVKDGLLVFGAS